MTNEILQQAKVLQQKIANAESRLEDWNRFESFLDGKIEGPDQFYMPADGSEMVLKSYNINFWERELERLQREFDAL
jgi:hypothetical protein